MPKDADEFTVKEMEAIPQDVVNDLIGSMKRICKLILEKNGDRILY